jgi:hypothetical protein
MKFEIPSASNRGIASSRFPRLISRNFRRVFIQMRKSFTGSSGNDRIAISVSQASTIHIDAFEVPKEVYLMDHEKCGTRSGALLQPSAGSFHAKTGYAHCTPLSSQSPLFMRSLFDTDPCLFKCHSLSFHTSWTISWVNLAS